MLKKLIQNVKNDRGVTISELLVSFAILSLFMVSATIMISSIINLYYNVEGTTNGFKVSENLCNKIVGEIESAKKSSFSTEVMGVKLDDVNMVVTSQKVEFISKTGSHVNISLKNEGGKKYFCEHYYPVKKNAGLLYDEVDWTFDKNTYMGYSVKSIDFSSPGSDYPNNVIKMKLIVNHPRYGDYETTEYISCYNFSDTDSIEFR